jgi:hypothetical protein
MPDSSVSRRLLGASFAVCFLALAVHAEETEETRRAGQNRQEAFRRIEESHPGLKVSELWDFHKRHAPDRIQEFERACKTSGGKAQAILVRMADRYLELEELRAHSPEEYARLVELEELESRARDLGRRIATLARSVRSPDDVGYKSLLEARRELRTVLEGCFERSQQNHLIELNRLEAEVRDLRALLQQRQGARELILQQRFLDLSGVPWQDEKK